MNDTSNVQAVNNAQPSVNTNNTGVAPTTPVNNIASAPAVAPASTTVAAAPVAAAPAPAPTTVAAAPIAAAPAPTVAPASTPASVVTSTATTKVEPPVGPTESSAVSTVNTTEPEKKLEEQPNNDEEDDDEYAVGGNRKIPIVLSLVFVGLIGILSIYYYVFFTAERIFTKIVDSAILEVTDYVENLDMATINNKQLKVDVTATIPGMEFEDITGQSFSALLSADIKSGTYGLDINGSLNDNELINAHLYNIDGSLYAEVGSEGFAEIFQYDHNYNLALGNDKTKVQSMLEIAKIFINYAFFEEDTASSRTVSRTIFSDKIAEQTLTGLKTTYSISEEQFVELVKDFAGDYANNTELINSLSSILNMEATELTHNFNEIANNFSEAHSVNIEFYTNLATTKILGVGFQIDNHHFKFNNLYGMIFVNYTYEYVNESNENVSISVDFNIDPYENYQETTTITLSDSYMYIKKGLEVKFKRVDASQVTKTATRITYKDGLVKQTRKDTETKEETLVDMYGLATDDNDKAFASFGITYNYDNNVKNIDIVAPENGVKQNDFASFLSAIKNNEMIKEFLETNDTLITCIFENEGSTMQPGEISNLGGGAGMMGGDPNAGGMIGGDPNAGGMIGGDPNAGGMMNGSTTTPNTGETIVGGVVVQPTTPNETISSDDNQTTTDVPSTDPVGQVGGEQPTIPQTGDISSGTFPTE